MELSNVEFILLQFICDRPMVSGYEINQMIKARGYKEWADIGTTSIYVGLNKLSGKKLVTSHIDLEKQGRGPVPRKFEITSTGKDVLQQETIAALSATRERDFRFDLALAAIPFVTREEVVTALTRRKSFLAEVADGINRKLESLGENKLPVNLQALYWHPLILIKNEIEFMDHFIEDLMK
ncbi:MAG: helix-turn-helix transcriptional regulator [Negativicutes bacterium]|nr:helix-turn-helix transcriptional regulator [Negativicutes bacterium]MDR3591195.1 helix-turn-helix transcriptional regulator [Negativicutes bacterium]